MCVCKLWEVSVDEWINVMVMVVIKAGSSGYSVEAFNGSLDDMVFSDWFVVVMVKIFMLVV